MGKIEFKIFKKVHCVHCKGTGDISFEYLISRIKDLHNHPDFDFSFNSFIDFENATVSFEDSGLEVYQSFFKDLQKAKIKRKWAIYSGKNITAIAANMSHVLLSKEIGVDVFEVREQALEYLRITDKDLV